MRIVLHIGLEKTGSTAIQAYCRLNRRAFLDQGILYPAGLGGGNHVALAASAENDAVRDDIRLRAGITSPGALTEYRARIASVLARAVTGSQPEVLLISSEHLSSRLADIEEIQRLKDTLAPLAADFQVIVYLRRQDRALSSLYSTAVKCGETRGIEFLAEEVDWFDYDTLLARWEAVFGNDAIRVRLFPPEIPLVEDFCATAGVPLLGQRGRAGRVNRSLDARNLEVLRFVNRYVSHFIGRYPNPVHFGLGAVLERLSTGRPAALPGAVRIRLLARVAEGNERVRARYFPDRPTLFETDGTEIEGP